VLNQQPRILVTSIQSSWYLHPQIRVDVQCKRFPDKCSDEFIANKAKRFRAESRTAWFPHALRPRFARRGAKEDSEVALNKVRIRMKNKSMNTISKWSSFSSKTGVRVHTRYMLALVLLFSFNPSVARAGFVGPSMITINGSFADWTNNVYAITNATLSYSSSWDLDAYWTAMSTANGTSPASAANRIQNVYYRLDVGGDPSSTAYWIQMNLGVAPPGYADHIMQIYPNKTGTSSVSLTLFQFLTNSSTPYPAVSVFTVNSHQVAAEVSNDSTVGAPVTDTTATGAYAANGSGYSIEIMLPIGWFTNTTYGGAIHNDGTGPAFVESAVFSATGSKGAVGTPKGQINGASGGQFFAQQSTTTGSVTFTTNSASGYAFSVGAAAATLTPVAGASDNITLTVNQNNNGTIQTDTTYTGAHNVTISGFTAAPNGSFGSLNGTNLVGSSVTISVTFASGVATIPLILDNAALQNIQFSISDLTVPQANILAITPTAGAVSKLVFTNSPVTTTAGVASGTITVQRQDQYSNSVSVAADRTVNLSSDSTGTVTFSGGTTVTITNGSSTVSFTYTDTKSGTPTITAASTSPTTVTSATQQETVTAAAVNAGQSTVSASPGSVTADGTTTSTVTVTLKDAYGNPVSTKTVSLAKNSGPGTPTISAASGPSSSSGVVTFTVKSTTAGTDVFAATDTTDSTAITQTANVVFTPGAATHLVFVQQPTTTTAGSAISPAVTVYVEDANGNVVTNNSSSVTISSGTTGFTGGSTLTVAAVNGVATFSAVDPTTTGTANTLTASDGALTGATSNQFTVNAANANKLVFTTQPSTTTAGSAISPAVVVTVEDTYGNPVTSFTGNVTISSGTTSFNGGTLSVNAVGGVATFNAIDPTTAGTANTLYANGDSLPQVTSGTFTVNAAAASQLVVTTPPSASTVAGVAFAQQPVVKIEDRFGNTVTSGADSSRVVTVSLTTGGGTLSGTLTATASGGVANFAGNNLSINLVGTDKVLTFTTTGGVIASTTTSPAFAITLPPISILRGPGAGIKIHVSNLLTSDATWDGYSSQAYASSDSTTTNSVSLAISGSGGSTLIVYPSSAANTADSFQYTITDSNGTRTGTVNIVINTNLTGQAGSISLNGSGATMTFYGVPGYHYAVERSPDLSSWSNITVTSSNASVDNSLGYSVITAPAGGAFTVTDPSPPAGNAYYQLRATP
jgi:hypothetical protein